MHAAIDKVPVVYEDDWLLVVNKPSGMLSQPGKHIDGSVLTRVLQSGRQLHGPVLVHRLDMDTSGLLLLAKSRDVHRAMQQLFEKRQVKKRYRALLEHPVTGLGGCIRLPLRLDIDDRPRQIVCKQHGKESTTIWKRAASQDPCGITFYPLTGRTHQLRVHAASPCGLGQPIRGDRLYGSDSLSTEKNSSAAYSVKPDRLMLHAECLQFQHPFRKQQLCVFCPAPF